MKLSRLRRFEEKEASQRFTANIIGIIVIFVILLTLGIPALTNFSLLIDTLKSKFSPGLPNQEVSILPFSPRLETPYTATNSASIMITGYGLSGTKLQVFVNNEKIKEITLPGDGQFAFEDVTLKEGENKITATSTDSSGNTSRPSEPLVVSYKKIGPKLEILSPNDQDKISGEKAEVKVVGTTEENTTVTINNRLVMLKPDNRFEYFLKLNEGENQIKITATDLAGNETVLERKVIYAP